SRRESYYSPPHRLFLLISQTRSTSQFVSDRSIPPIISTQRSTIAMSNLPVETTEPDPAATSISNDETVNTNGGDASAPTIAETVMTEAAPEAKKAETEDADMDNSGEAKIKKESPDGKDWKKNGGDRNRERNGDSGRKFKNNSKYDPSVLPESDNPKLIRGQVEYYFGDSNLPTDKHMWELTDGTANKPVSIKHIHEAFKRMHRFQPYEIVVAALKDSKFLDVIGEEGAELAKRKVAYNPASRPSTEVQQKSVYVKGFGEEEPSSQFDIEAFFTQYGATNSVKLRRNVDDKSFKGSVFVEFQDVETADAFLNLEPKPQWKGKHDLEIKPKSEYEKGKKQDIDDGIMEPGESWGPPSRSRGRGRGGRGGRGNHDRQNNHSRRDDRGGRGRNDRGDREDRDQNDWKKRREEDRANGFKDHRGGRKDNNRDRNQRSGRGRRDDRGPRNNDRNREREGDKDKEVKSEDKSESSPAKDIKIKQEETTPVKNDKKRAREDDGADEGGPAKKVDSKSEVPVEASS
ncbi:La protein-like protein, partial [Lachnellula suecica]